MAGARTRESTAGLVVPVLVMGLLAAGAAAMVVDRDTPEPPAAREATCRPITVAVTRGMLEPMKSAANGVADVETCVEFEVVEADPAFGEVPDADLWVPAGRHLALAAPTADVVTTSLASTPVLWWREADGSEPAPATWADALVGGETVTADPSSDPASALALLTASKRGGLTGAGFGRLLLTSAQGTMDDTASGEVDVMTEQTAALVTAADERPGAPVALRRTPFLDHPLLRLRALPDGTQAEDDDPLGTAAERLVDWLASGPGVATLHDAGLRGPDRAPTDTLRAGSVPVEPAVVTSDEFEAMAQQWQRLHVAPNTLVVLDASGSMKDATGGVPRARIAADALSDAIGASSGRARMGLWTFAVNRGGPDQDWTELVAQRPLRSRRAGTRQRDLLLQALTRYPTDLAGGTGLYDTTLSAYRRAQKDYRPGHDNTLLLITDGSDDDTGSLSLEAVVEQLADLVDPDRPVRIIGVAVGADDDTSTVAALAEATGGTAHRVDDEADLRDLRRLLSPERT